MSITTAELSAMRDFADDYLTATCTIQRATSGVSSSGSPTQTWGTLASNVACRMDEPKQSAAEANINGSIAAPSTFIMHLKYDQDVTVKDRIVYGSLTYEVQEVLDTASWLMSRRLVVTRID